MSDTPEFVDGLIVKAPLSADRLREVLRYDQETGVFTWLVSRRGHTKVGNVAGCVRPDGYVGIKIDGTLYLAHRLAWLYTTGNFPANQIDHRNGDKAANWIANLREATYTENHQNRISKRNGTSGYLGVCWHNVGRKWVARIAINGKTHNLGLFSTEEAAHAAYCAAKAEIHRFNPVPR